MSRHQVQYAGIFSLIGMTLVLLTHLVRPSLGAFHSSWIVFIFGVLPNFGAAFSLPFLMIMLATRFSNLESGSSKLPIYFVICLGVTFFGLAAWEVIQNLVWGYPIDPYDIAATGLGVAFAICAYFVFMRTIFSASKS